MSVTQTLRILSYMQGGGSLTGLEALQLFGCMRLGARILDIKKAGFTVEDTWELHRNENGEYKRVKRYRLGGMDAA